MQYLNHIIKWYFMLFVFCSYFIYYIICFRFILRTRYLIELNFSRVLGTGAIIYASLISFDNVE